MKTHENVLVFYKNLPLYNAQKTTGHKPANRNSKKSPKQTTNYGAYEKVESGGQTDRYPVSIVKFNVVNSAHGVIHPTQKPVDLFEYFIKTYTNEGDTVLDNCIGSGTTAVACINTNRNFIGIEKEPEYFHIANKRINNALWDGL